MKYIILSALIFFATSSYSQQLRIKSGLATSIFSKGWGNGYAFESPRAFYSPLPSGLFVEYNKPLHKRKNFFLNIGTGVSVQRCLISLNAKNFLDIPQASGYSTSVGSFKFYASVEKQLLTHQKSISTNRLSAFIGVGISTQSGEGGSVYTNIGDGTTKNGESFQGVKFAASPYPAENYLKVTSSGTKLSPDIFGGIRWDIRNKKGNSVVILELMINLGLTTKYRFAIPYYLNGNLTQDIIRDNGNSIQLNLIIPLSNFRKKKN